MNERCDENLVAAAAAVIVVAVMIGIKPFGESTSVLAAMTKNVEQMPWIRMVRFKGEHLVTALAERYILKKILISRKGYLIRTNCPNR